MPLPKSRWTGFGSEQPEFVARNMATQKFVPQKDRFKKTNLVKVLGSRGFFQEAPAGFGTESRGLPLTPESAP